MGGTSALFEKNRDKAIYWGEEYIVSPMQTLHLLPSSGERKIIIFTLNSLVEF